MTQFSLFFFPSRFRFGIINTHKRRQLKCVWGEEERHTHFRLFSTGSCTSAKVVYNATATNAVELKLERLRGLVEGAHTKSIIKKPNKWWWHVHSQLLSMMAEYNWLNESGPRPQTEGPVFTKYTVPTRLFLEWQHINTGSIVVDQWMEQQWQFGLYWFIDMRVV